MSAEPPPSREAVEAGGSGPDPEARPSGGEHPVLRAATPLAILGLVALVMGRVIAPAVKSVGVGMGWLVSLLGLVGALASQWFAFAAMMIAIVAVLAASRSRLSLGVRIAALSLGGFAVLPTIWAVQQPVPDLSAALVAASASLLALIAAPTILRAPFTRAPGLVIGLIAFGGVVRLAAIGGALQGTLPRIGSLLPFAPPRATGALLCDTAAIAVALVWIAAQKKKLTSPGTLAILALAMLLTNQALAGQSPDAHGFKLLCWRAASRLVTRPEASLPVAFQIFVGFLAPLTAAAALTARDGVISLGVPLGAVVALALAAHGATEMPPCALMLMVSALAAAMAASDGRALWASLARSRVADDRAGPS